MTWINKIQPEYYLEKEQEQIKTLAKLLKKAQYTAFGEHYNFEIIRQYTKINEFDFAYKLFKKNVPIVDYSEMYEKWWHKLQQGEKNVCWPGKIKHFALSSGTTGVASKLIPVSKTMIKNIQSVSIKQFKQILKLENQNPDLFKKSYLLVGGSSTLNKSKGMYYGDLSGILQKKLPKWFNSFYKPGSTINAEKEWELKINKIVEEAPKWDIGFIAGIPSWVVLLFERICTKYNLKNIHEIWPNLTVYVWGGVAIDPYINTLDKYFDPNKNVKFLETYLASEGFFAYQKNYDSKLQLVIDKGIFYEFIPFDDNNFFSDGTLKPKPNTLLVHQLEEGVQYAMVISTCGGAWRYIIGDTISFINLKKLEFKITGRTKQSLNLCGEHVSVDNLNQVIAHISNKFQVKIPEYTVVGSTENGKSCHHWYLGLDRDINKSAVIVELDHVLKSLNDDYAVERNFALSDIKVSFLSPCVFYDFMGKNNKLGNQNKFPRVLSGEKSHTWEHYLEELNFINTILEETHSL